jgi:hypothetical protein
MATWDDVERLAMAMPLVEERADGGFDGWRTWKITGPKGRQVVWERPLRPSDLRDLGGSGPEGEIIAVRVADAETKAERLASSTPFRHPTSRASPACSCCSTQVDVDDLRELIEESWLAVAPAKAASGSPPVR